MPTPPSPTQASLPPGVAVTGEGDQLALEGVLDIRTLAAAETALTHWLRQRKSRALDIGKLSDIDTPGALFLCGLRGKGVELTGIRAEHKSLLDLICGLELKPLPKPATVPRWRQFVIDIGKGADEAWRDALDVITFIGRAASATGHALMHPGSLPLPAISRQVAETGVNALPIVGIMAVMISVVIGYQGVAQLRPYGGEDFTINLVAVSVLREMGVLITAIMVAGRTGAAFTAEIGVMMAREEVDALKVMGIEPMTVLVVPRVIGLMITLPLLAFFADIMGLLGGAGIAHVQLGVSPIQYVDRVHHAVDLSDLLVGLVKAPVFAFLIAIIGCMHGLRVRGSAESVGKETTRSVVKAIFLVIVLDALFSIFFEKLGW
ncbi:MAG: MlaE family lipid ABC transporter permease subunit [Betaproteobacteria bacterium]